MILFENWCALKGVLPLPATPQSVALFINDCAPIGAKKVWDAVREISLAHVRNGEADPTAGGVAAMAMNGLSMIDPPRSWPNRMKERFAKLPWDVQVFLSEHEERRDKEVRRAHTQVEQANRKLKEANAQTAAA